jgi:hypothetical protein
LDKFRKKIKYDLETRKTLIGKSQDDRADDSEKSSCQEHPVLTPLAMKINQVNRDLDR